ncbi:MAG: ABC transporter permease [Rhodococcus sp. (in: high G+C Gram-positive bacteria)]|uniref:ABC transporter permease n=1 Tax=Rhodococcus sp. TaxID=1831 RepID=UPI003BB7EBF6
MTDLINRTTADYDAVTDRSRLRKWLHDVGAVFTREILVVLRDPFSLIFSLLQPLVFLALFGPLLDGMLGAGGIDGESALQWFLPGVLVMIAIFGTGMVGGNLLYELMTGAYERILATPLDRSSILVGRALKEFAPLVVQALLITVVAIPFGLAFYPVQVLVGLLILGIFGIGLGALSYALGLAAKGREWLFWGVQQSVIFPLLLLAGMMLPLDAGPGWMQAVAKLNPLTYVVDAERALFTGTLWDADVAWGFVAAFVTCAVGLWVGIRTVNRTI